MKLHFDMIHPHANGKTAEPFHAAIFRRGKDRWMLGIVFQPKKHVAIFNLDALLLNCIAPDNNSWRGDRFEPHLRKAIQQLKETSI